MVSHGKLFDRMDEVLQYVIKEHKDPEAVTFAETENDYMRSVFL